MVARLEAELEEKLKEMEDEGNENEDKVSDDSEVIADVADKLNQLFAQDNSELQDADSKEVSNG